MYLIFGGQVPHYDDCDGGNDAYDSKFRAWDTFLGVESNQSLAIKKARDWYTANRPEKHHGTAWYQVIDIDGNADDTESLDAKIIDSDIVFDQEEAEHERQAEQVKMAATTFCLFYAGKGPDDAWGWETYSNLRDIINVMRHWKNPAYRWEIRSQNPERLICKRTGGFPVKSAPEESPQQGDLINRLIEALRLEEERVRAGYDFAKD